MYPANKSLLTEAAITYLLADGAMGTEFRKAGLPLETPPELLNLINADSVSDLHKQYLNAGAHCITTNTFGANRFRLAACGLDEGTVEVLVQAALAAAKSAMETSEAASTRDQWILGSVGPCSSPGERLAITNPQDVTAAYMEQIVELAFNGADAILIETVTCLEEGRLALNAAREAAQGLPVIVSLCFQNAGGAGRYTMPRSGEPLDTAITTVASWSPSAIGVNCGINLDISDYATIVAAMRAKFDGVIMARPPAGPNPEAPDSPELMADGIWGLIRAGANIVGGCCGTTPDHIRLFAAELERLH